MKIPCTECAKANLQVVQNRDAQNKAHQITQRRADDTTRIQDHTREVRVSEEKITRGRLLDARA